MANGIIVFTGKSTSTLLADGGSGCWTLSPARARLYEYVVCTWNAHSRLGEREDVEHGAAFLIAPITGTSRCARDPIPGRVNLVGVTLQFDRYAAVNVPNVWNGKRNPVWYVDDVEAQLGVRLDTLRLIQTRRAAR